MSEREMASLSFTGSDNPVTCKACPLPVSSTFRITHSASRISTRTPGAREEDMHFSHPFMEFRKITSSNYFLSTQLPYSFCADKNDGIKDGQFIDSRIFLGR